LCPSLNEAEKEFPERLDLPVFRAPQSDWHPGAVDWQTVIEETEPLRRYYLEHFDSPEKRLRDKNPKPFRMDF
jgi:hypothetical protein